VTAIGAGCGFGAGFGFDAGFGAGLGFGFDTGFGLGFGFGFGWTAAGGRFLTRTTRRRRATRPSTASAATVRTWRPSPTLCVFQVSRYGALRSRLTTSPST
jgi:hypothetical protein